jgi:hypothetical protein
MKKLWAAIFILPVILFSFRDPDNLTVDSPDFQQGGQIPAKYTCEGASTSPRLKIGNIPDKAAALAIIVHDPDAPKQGGVSHWVAWNLPASGDIPEGYNGGMQGLNSDGTHGYKAICPSEGTHHYNFYVYALDTQLKVDDNVDEAGLQQLIKGHILAQGELTGVYTKGGQ